ncbi:hypothetical protein FE257_001345 [Aspergillus nanangensis]|uniref:Uncharacterized protein n=1 Tax=Aspergillus nanangensis TaxID=2582783 RepID=A0AAD4CDZ0_ASPNN|nr:hypothetical protein FE257_001345 [Aspergillus nanangensis]
MKLSVLLLSGFALHAVASGVPPGGGKDDYDNRSEDLTKDIPDTQDKDPIKAPSGLREPGETPTPSPTPKVNDTLLKQLAGNIPVSKLFG